MTRIDRYGQREAGLYLIRPSRCGNQLYQQTTNKQRPGHLTITISLYAMQFLCFGVQTILASMSSLNDRP